MVILGAGASKACPTTHPNVPMPVLRELPDVFSHFNPNSRQYGFGQKLKELLESTNDDIEVLLTVLYHLNYSHGSTLVGTGADSLMFYQ